MAALSVSSPRRKLNSTAATKFNPTASAAMMVTRLRLVPGHNARTCAPPMIAAWRNVNDSSAAPPRPDNFGHSTNNTTPPTIHAATTGHGFKSLSVMIFSPPLPMMAAGMKATTSANSSLRPGSLRPINPCSTSTTRRHDTASTARMAPIWMMTV